MEREFSVFYSWQSGAHDKENRYLIEACLKNVAKQLEREGIHMRIDQDTRGAAGSADIPSTVFQKVEASDFFVGDLSIMNPDAEGQRKTPNPNVLLELGYAAHALGWERTVCVFNTCFGKVEDVPFDIRHRRMLTYDSSGDLQAAKGRLTNTLHRAIAASVEQGRDKAGLAQAKASVAELLLAGIQYAWGDLMEQDGEVAAQQYSPLSTVIAAPVVLEVHRQQTLLLQTALDAADYALLDDMLAQIRLMRHGTEDAYGWEYARTLAAHCFEPLWMEYRESLAPFQPEQCLRKEVVGLLNQLLPEDRQILYSDLREAEGGKSKFFANPAHVEAWSENEELLIRADLDENGKITGWKQDREYCGQYRGGVRHGAGTDFYHTFCGSGMRLEGRWEDGQFVEGVVYQTILLKDEAAEDGFVFMEGAGDLPLQLFDVQMDSLLHSHMPDTCKELFVADMKLHTGLFDIIGTPAPLCPKRKGEASCFDCPEEGNSSG